MISKFVDTGAGRLLICVHQPPLGSAPVRWILHLPAFAEEMNKSRAMVSRNARELAQRGSVVVVPDLYGTGDSEGEFAQASWVRWLEDVSFLVSWMRAQGAERIGLWGLRTGCLLALDWVSQNPDDIQDLLLWHPVHQGQQAITQFLRLRMAAGLMSGNGETVAELRELAVRTGSLEVAGYELSAELIRQMDSVALPELPPPSGVRVTLLEVAVGSGRPLSAVSRKLLDSWALDPATVTAEVVGGDQFWATQEIASAPDLVARSQGAFACQHTSDRGLEPRVGGVDKNSEAPERTLLFSCGSDELVGVYHAGKPRSDRALVLVVGGPQYRVGSHRQFVSLARHLAQAGIPVLRFDYRGMGDSSGEPVGFEGASEDIRAAIDVLQGVAPQASKIFIWGLCDAASAAAFYAGTDSRVAGLVLLNPWVRSESGEARAYLKYYYLQRLVSPEFWAKLRGGRLDLRKSLRDLREKLRESTGGDVAGGQDETSQQVVPATSLADRFYQGLHVFPGPTQFIFSGNDLTAAEFRDAAKASRGFRKLMKSKRVQVKELAEADHTFSRQVWKQRVAEWTTDWVLRN